MVVFVIDVKAVLFLGGGVRVVLLLVMCAETLSTSRENRAGTCDLSATVVYMPERWHEDDVVDPM